MVPPRRLSIPFKTPNNFEDLGRKSEGKSHFRCRFVDDPRQEALRLFATSYFCLPFFAVVGAEAAR